MASKIGAHCFEDVVFCKVGKDSPTERSHLLKEKKFLLKQLKVFQFLIFTRVEDENLKAHSLSHSGKGAWIDSKAYIYYDIYRSPNGEARVNNEESGKGWKEHNHCKSLSKMTRKNAKIGSFIITQRK